MQAKISMELATRKLLCNGVPKFEEVRLFKPLGTLIDENGEAVIHAALFCLVWDFCQSVNVVRNMTEGQMIEAAGFLMSECGNFRLEDYVLMFTMAKRGQLIKIMDRVDVPMIGQMLDAYWTYRDIEGKKLLEKEFSSYDNQINRAIAFPVSEKGQEFDFKGLVEQLKAIPDRDPIKKPLKSDGNEIIELIAKAEKENGKQ